jgi:hypothetical protein
MKHLWLVTLLAGAALAAGKDRQAEVNVNERYTVEAVSVSGVDETKISKGLREDLQKLVGEKFSQQKVTELIKRLQKGFPNRAVSQKVSRGLTPEHVKLVLVVARRIDLNADFSATKAHYHSKQGWTGEVSVSPGDLGANNRFSFGILSNADDLLERFAGLRAGYERLKLGTDRVRLAFQFESYHQIWNRSTLDELKSSPDVPGIYRTRQNFEPALTFLLANPLKLSVGASFQRFQTQFPAARTEAANAVITTLRYDRQLEDSAANRHRLEAGYGLRAATRTLDSDFVYARHTWDLRYRFRRGDNRLEVQFVSGVISGRAPLFERFVLGNSQTLRGWSKFDVAPLGASRMAHNSLEYRYKIFRVVYDAGAAWNRGQHADPKQSLGVGLRHHEFSLLVSFPVRAGRAEPMLIAGMNF